MNDKFTDIFVEAASDGIYDAVIEDGDLKLTAGMDSAIFVSLFTDRRANPDEVADPMKRRGWSGTELTPSKQGGKGSGIWLYEQRRLSNSVSEGVRMEAFQALQWLITEGLSKSLDITTENSPQERSLQLNIQTVAANGGVTNTGYAIWNGTPRRTLKK